jgi:hypothetical protein
MMAASSPRNRDYAAASSSFSEASGMCKMKALSFFVQNLVFLTGGYSHEVETPSDP